MTTKNIFFAVIAIAFASIISLSFTKFQKPVSKSSELVADWQRAKAYTLEYLNASTNEAIALKPKAEMRSFGQKMLHLAEANYNLAASASGKQSPVTFGQLEKTSDQYKTKEALTKTVMDSYDFVIAAIKETDDMKMAEMVKIFNFDMNRETAFRKVFEHQTHHRGQTTVYLRLAGLTPPNEKLF